MTRLFCKDRQAKVGRFGECLICDAAQGEACRRSAEGRKPDRASAGVGRPAGAPAGEAGDTAREAE
jgi:hypothetical protein